MILVNHKVPKGHAPATREMLKNVGFKKSRPKKYRTPRKHYRFKAAAAMMKIAKSDDRILKAEVEQVMKRQPKRVKNPSEYVGERTGIKAMRTRSRDLTADIDADCRKGRDYARSYTRMKLPRIVRGDKGKPEPNPLDKQEHEGIIRSFEMDDKGRMRPAKDDAMSETDDSEVSRPEWMGG